MISVLLTEPGDSFNMLDSRQSTAKISGGGYSYDPKQYLSGGEFEGSAGLWSIRDITGTEVETPVGSIVVNYEEAKDGMSSMFFTIGAPAECIMTRFASSTEEREILSGKPITFEFWVKNAQSGLYVQLLCVGTHTRTGDTTVSLPVTSVWTKVSVTTTFTYAITDPEINDIKLFAMFGTSGAAPLTAFIDSASIFTPTDLSDIPTSTYITINPNLSTSSPQQYVGSYCVIVGGNNNRYGSLISSIENTGNDITKIWLTDILPFTFTDGDEFVILTLNQSKRSTTGQMASVGQYVIGCTTSSDIETGYSKSSIKLTRDAGTVLYRYDISDWTVEISDDYGVVWIGYVSEVETTSETVEITALGFRSKLDDIYFSLYYDSEPENTAVTIIKDIISLCPDLVQGASAALDRGDTIHNTQYASGGIGPIDFTASPQKASECISQVLSYGAFDENFSPVYLQVWGLVPSLVTVNRVPDPSNVRVIVEPQASPASSGVTYKTGLSQRYTSVYSTYSGTDGAQLETARMYNLRDLVKYGIIEKSLSGGSGSEAEADIHMNISLDEFVPSVTTGEVVVNNLVRLAGSSMYISPAHIRAGDIIFVSEILGELPVAYVANRGYEVVVAGNVSSDLISGETTITPYSAPEMVEFSMNLLEINTGG